MAQEKNVPAKKKRNKTSKTHWNHSDKLNKTPWKKNIYAIFAPKNSVYMHMHPRLVHAHEQSAIIRVVGKSSLGYNGTHTHTHIYIYAISKKPNSIIPRFRSWLNRVTTAESGWSMGTKWPAPSTKTCSSVHPAPVIVLVWGWIIQESEKTNL